MGFIGNDCDVIPDNVKEKLDQKDCYFIKDDQNKKTCNSHGSCNPVGNYSIL